jgi:hypothetical protein
MAASTGAACGMNIGWPCVSGVRLVQNILTGEGRCGFSIYCSRGFKEAVGEAGV